MNKTGACLCGNVKYEVEGDLIGVINCHCKDCQRIHGNYNPFLVTSVDKVFFPTGLPTWYKSGETTKRGFCSVCGSAMFKKNITDSKLLISAGSFDHTDDFDVIKNIWEQSKGVYYKY